MAAPDLVFAENSPYDSVEAIVEQDENVAFFYLRCLDETNRFGMKSCWIRNLAPAPESIDVDVLKQGRAPMLPRDACRITDGQDRLDEKQLRVVWFEEGDGAALLEGDQCLAVIPAWGGVQGFHGYSRDCVKDSALCSPLSDAVEIESRVSRADQFWKSWENENSPWSREQPKLLEAYEARLGSHAKYYTIDGDHWPPKALLRFESDKHVILTTLGVSLCPQPGVELHFEHAGLMQRIELACCFSKSISEKTIDFMIRYLSGQSSLPWSQLAFLAHGHTLTCQAMIEDDDLPDFSSVLLWGNHHLSYHRKASSRPDQGSQSCEASLKMPKVQGDPVNLLWMVPIFENERHSLSQTGPELLAEKIIGSGEFPVIGPRNLML